MTNPSTSRVNGIASPPHTPVQEEGAGEQQILRTFIVAIHAALRALRLYPAENDAVKHAIAMLGQRTAAVLEQFGHCEIRCSGTYLFVNATRVRLQVGNYAAVSHVLGRLRHAGVGGFNVASQPSTAAWVAFLSELVRFAPKESEWDRRTKLVDCVQRATTGVFEIVEASEHSETGGEVSNLEQAQQTYLRSLSATRNILTSSRLGRSPSLKQAKRAVQGIVDAVMTDSTSILGLTTLREFDDYTFVHSVNVCILAIALGRRLQLNKIQLLDLGLAALMHDIGKSRIPVDTLNKREALTPEEFAVLQSHTELGVLALCGMHGSASRSWRAMTTAYEHHMRIDLTGYPKVHRPRQQSLFSKIVAIVDGFDAATSTRVYKLDPWSPADVVRGMRDNPRLGLDPVLVKAFINLTGIYPVGTVVTLDTYEVAIVHARNEDDQALSRPIVQVLFDDRGNRTVDSPLVDLTQRNAAGAYERTIIRTENPDRFGIRVGSSFA